MQWMSRIAQPSRSLLRVIGALSCVVVLGGLALTRLSAAELDGCQSVAASSITESQAVTAYQERLTHGPDLSINPDNAPAAVRPAFAPSAVDDLPISWVRATTGFTQTLYLDKPVGPSMTQPDFFAAGGLMLLSFPADPSAGPYVASLMAELGARATSVEVGQSEGVLVWGDPMSNGVRPHHLSWSVGDMNYRLVGVRSAEGITTLARMAAC